MKAIELRRRSEQLVATGRIREAGDLVAEALTLQPYDSDLLIAKANIMLAGSQFRQAIETLTELTARKPDFTDAWFLLGNAYRATRLPAEAVRCYETVLRQAPRYPGAQHFLGIARQQFGDLAGAERAFEAACELRPELALLRWRLGVAQHLQGRLEPAIASYRQALRRDPAHHASLSNLSQALIELERDTDAMAAARQHLAHAPGHAMALANLLYAAIGAEHQPTVSALLRHETFVAVRDGALDPAELNSAAAALSRQPIALGSADGAFLGREFTAEEQPELSSVTEVIRASVAEHFTALRSDSDAQNHPWLSALPARWQLRFWGEAYDSASLEPTHCHPRAAMSGLLYLDVPATSDGDAAPAVTFNVGDEAFLNRAPESLFRQPVAAGTLLVFPGYYFHQTLPAAASPRVRLAFDVLPESG